MTSLLKKENHSSSYKKVDSFNEPPSIHRIPQVNYYPSLDFTIDQDPFEFDQEHNDHTSFMMKLKEVHLKEMKEALMGSVHL